MIEWHFPQTDDGAPRLPSHVLPHEIGHEIFIRFLMPRTGADEYGGGAPDWLDEMAAIALEDASGVQLRREEARRHAQSGALIPLARLLTMPHPEWQPKGSAADARRPGAVRQPGSPDTPAYYATVRALFDFLIDRTADERVIPRLVERIKQGDSVEKWLLDHVAKDSATAGLSALDAEMASYILASPTYGARNNKIGSRDSKTLSVVSDANPVTDEKPAKDDTLPRQDEDPVQPEITGPDGEPLSPEIQRELLELIKNAPPVTTKTTAPQPNSDGSITVTAKKPRGAVVGDIPAIRSLNPLDIKAYGADDVGALIEALGPQVGSAQGGDDASPVVLLNGKRVSSFLEIASIPTEAIERTEVFPEELALKYGFPANQKVVNIVTYENFSSTIGQAIYTLATDGGFDSGGVGGNLLKIAGDSRYTLDVNYSRAGSLLESERNLVQIAGLDEIGLFRSLVPDSERLTVDGAIGGQWVSGVSFTLNARYDDSVRTSLLGLGNDGPLVRDIDQSSFHVGAVSGGRIGKWSWTLTANYDHTSVDTLTDTILSSDRRDEANLVNRFADIDALFTGSLFSLPAGPITSSIRIGGETRDLRSSASLASVNATTDIALARDIIGAQVNVDFPIARRGRPVLRGLGDLSVNVNFATRELSDLGALSTLGYGINWSPIDRVNFVASFSNEEAAPSVEQLGLPVVVTPNARIFDFIRGETVDITRIFGGNPGLRAEDRETVKLAVNAKPFAKTDLVISVDYLKTRIENPIAVFPLLTPDIELAFPDRFVRGGSGQLVQVDGRPINFARSDQQQIRTGVNFTRPLGKVAPGLQNRPAIFVRSAADLQSALPPGARIVTVAPGSASARQFENAASRLTLSLYHTFTLVDEILVSEGGPTMDLLDGSAIGLRGGTPRHRVEFQATAFKKGLGARASVNWQSGTGIRGTAAVDGSPSNLDFASLATVNLNLFANLGDRFAQGKASSWLKGTRISLGVTNLFNQRQKVRDLQRLTPLNFQPAFLDPLGRLVSLSVRKIF